MNKIISICSLLLFVSSVNAQQAGDYFPDQQGFVWNFRVTPLDSLNNEIDTLAYARRDTFAVVSNHQGKNASIVPTKNGPFQTIHLQPYLDSLFYHFEGTDGYEFFDLGPLEIILAQLDSLGIDTTFSFLEFFKSLEDWYPVYKFASGVNTEYTLLSRDTIINTPIGSYTFRFQYLGKRLQDQNLQTAIGTFNCKKFFLKWKVSVLLLPPPLPPVEVLSTRDTVWIAPDYWIVRDIIPTNHIDLSFFGVDPFSVPGLKTEIENVTSIKEEYFNPETFYLSQNYPNPFNPSTKIKFTIPSVGTSFMQFVQLKIYDVLGNEVATLVNEELPAGTYEVEFSSHTGNGSSFRLVRNLSTGVYFYKLTAGSYSETRKMVLIK